MLEACSEDLVRLKEEIAACKEELREGHVEICGVLFDERGVTSQNSEPGL